MSGDELWRPRQTFGVRVTLEKAEEEADAYLERPLVREMIRRLEAEDGVMPDRARALLKLGYIEGRTAR